MRYGSDSVRARCSSRRFGLKTLVTACMILALASLASGLEIPRAPTTRVNDYAGALSAGDRDKLEGLLAERERATKAQMVVGVFRSLQGENLEQYTLRVAKKWKVGRGGVNDGVVFFIFLDDRKMRLEVGTGLEKVITNAEAGRILTDVTTPRMREGRVAAAIEGTIDAVFSRVAAQTGFGSDQTAEEPKRVGGGGPQASGYAIQLVKCDKLAQFSDIKVEVGPSVELADDSVARQILAEGATFSREKCPITKGFSNIVVWVSQPGGNSTNYICSFGMTRDCVVRGRNYDQDKLTWREYTNLARQARLADEQRRQSEEQSRIIQERQRAEQERIRQQNEAREAALEAEKRTRRARFDEFTRKYGVQEWVRTQDLAANPFVFQGKRIGMTVGFHEMVSPTEGVFGDGPEGAILVTGIPNGFFRARGQCVLIGSVVGKGEVRLPVLGTISVPKMTFVGAHICQSWDCSDFLPK